MVIVIVIAWLYNNYAMLSIHHPGNGNLKKSWECNFLILKDDRKKFVTAQNCTSLKKLQPEVFLIRARLSWSCEAICAWYSFLFAYTRLADATSASESEYRFRHILQPSWAWKLACLQMTTIWLLHEVVGGTMVCHPGLFGSDFLYCVRCTGLVCGGDY